MTKVIFFLSAGLIIYTYFGYPFILFILAGLKRKERAIRGNKNKALPMVSLLIAARNEEAAIAKRIENAILLDYPREKLEIIVISDSSTDNTDKIVRQYRDKGIILHRSAKWLGKIAAYKSAMKKVRGEIIVFSDATSSYNKDTIKKLVHNFSDKNVGCVCGQLKYINPDNSMIGTGEGFYWKYEVGIRKKENLLGGLVAVTGTIYALRKELYFNFPNELADDLIIPGMVRKKGYKTVFEPEAICIEETTTERKEEFPKRVRITIQNIRGLFYMKELLNPFRYGIFSLELFSHKLLRMSAPLFLITAFISSVILAESSVVFRIFCILQAIFYLTAIIVAVLHGNLAKNKTISIPFYFCISNLAVLTGIGKALLGEKRATWKTTR